jgi:peptidoglycan/LPS O-acetylase OafA/YrhL
VFLGAAAIAGPLAYLSWHLVEKRALAWGRRRIALTTVSDQGADADGPVTDAVMRR